MRKDGKNDSDDQIAITFDDGYRDIYQNVLPILDKYQIPATAFITTGNIGTKEENWPDLVMRACLQPAIYHDYFDMENELMALRCYTRDLKERCVFYEIMGDVCARLNRRSREEQIQKLKLWAGFDGEGRESRRILNAQEILSLANSGLFTIGSHTVTHPMLKYMPREERLNEIRDSKNMLEEITGRPIVCFAYPYGGNDAYDEETIGFVKATGYQMAVTTEAKEVSAHCQLYQIPRWVVYNYNIKEFENFICKILKKKQLNDRETTFLSPHSKALKYIGSLMDDMEILLGKRKIIIWGYGYWGKQLYRDLKFLGLDKDVFAFGDKEAGKFNHVDCEIPIMNAEKIVAEVELSEVTILIKGVHDWDIFMELREKGFENLHIILR